MLKSLWATLIGLIIFTSSWGQQYSFISYSIKEGLASTQANAICQDAHGYIWIGTLGGVSRFDGLNFENYTSEDGLIGDDIYAIFHDSKGRIWIGSTGGISRYDGGKFTNFYLGEAYSGELSFEWSKIRVIDIAEDQEGNLWLATDFAGAVKFDESTFTYYLCERNSGR